LKQKLNINIEKDVKERFKPLLEIIGIKDDEEVMEFNYKTLKSPEFVNSKHPNVFD